jgi:hypothetical protein
MNQNQTNKPLGVYVVEEGEGKSYWTKVGAAFTHKNGSGFTILLTAVPLSGRLVVREAKANEGAGQ